MKKRFLLIEAAASLLLAAGMTNIVKADDVKQQNPVNTQQENKQNTADSQQKNNQTDTKQQNNQSDSQKTDQKQEETKPGQSSTTEKKPSTSVTKPVKKVKKVKKVKPSGCKVINGRKHYLKNGKIVKGLKKIDGHWYLFDKNGAMLKNLRKIPHTSHYGYFDQSDRRRMKNTSTKKAYYWINKNGTITGIKNNAKVVCQRPEMPTGCEITAVTMMLNFAGKHVSKFQAAKVMPRSSNPNKGFIGSPYKNFPLGYWVAPGGVKPVVKHYLGKAKIMTGCSISAIKKKLIRSHLVVAWMGWFDGFSNHAITLTGYHGNTLYFNDPWTGTKRSISVSNFKTHWALDAHRAISY
ncbi:MULTISPECIES: C39 family peptidase [Lactobacillus]|uniref:Peptidase C39-like domain-containing protein n=1 Tax=Lactobacillus xujianguonis TaxID=2495899 RepID=A0A437SU70_9LACO|nr:MULTISPECIES: C39 family peptidase [Lactobacillus]RVU70412.1 hypothetical protein EJK17_07825 [Lactobacillus xujianguonis]RVU73659.1 hypothetical protein EJK20_07150 [Lactobacillus xujianguonis]